VISLPITSDGYQQELGLNNAAMEEVNNLYASSYLILSGAQFKDDIQSLVGLYLEARNHCLEYKTVTFREILTLSRTMYSYSQSIEVCHFMLFFICCNRSSSQIPAILSGALSVNPVPPSTERWAPSHVYEIVE
jgi:hypothetical protein